MKIFLCDLINIFSENWLKSNPYALGAGFLIGQLFTAGVAS